MLSSLRALSESKSTFYSLPTSRLLFSSLRPDTWKPFHSIKPSIEPLSKIRKHKYSIIWDAERRIPKCVEQILTREDVVGLASGRHRWRSDMNIPLDHRSNGEDYAGIYADFGLSKGHLAAGGDFKSSELDRKETYLYSNCAPQYEVLNRGVWTKLEERARSLAKVADSVRIISGPLFVPLQDPNGDWYVKYRVIGKNPGEQPVAVPSHFFKIIAPRHSNVDSFQSYIVPNSPYESEKPLESYEEPIQKISKLSGLTFNFSSE